MFDRLLRNHGSMKWPPVAIWFVALIVSGCAVHGSPHGPENVAVCHKSKKTLVLPESAVEAHLGHGDTLGPC